MSLSTSLGQQRAIGTAGTIGRVTLGLFLILVPVWGPAWWGNGVQWYEAALGLLAFPAAVLILQSARLRYTTVQLQATNGWWFCLNFAIGAALFSMSFTRDAFALFIGASLLLAAARGYAGCEVMAISNWLLRRDDQVGCVVFTPIDEAEKALTHKSTVA